MLPLGLLLIINFVLTLAVILIPLASAGVRNAIAPIFCRGDETLEVRRTEVRGVEGDGYSYGFVCRSAETQAEREVTAWVFLAISPLVIIDTVLLAAVIRRATARAREQEAALVGMPGQANLINTGGLTGKQADLSARLRELQDAYHAGLISREEYDRKRAQVLSQL
jgi:hypothetical protein